MKRPWTMRLGVRVRVLALTPALACGIVACRSQQSFVEPEPGLERMLEQPRVDPFAGSSFYRDGMAMRAPPAGAVPIERRIGDPNVVTGMADGTFAEHVPIPVDRALLERGRERFEIVCATCHGITGDGRSVVADNMELRKPPSLHEDRIRAFPAGRLYHVIDAGYGLMPSYRTSLTVDERWSVVAYVRALELSRRADVAKLPPGVRAELEREAP
jgi:mono/diheme cytochrome c family protein